MHRLGPLGLARGERGIGRPWPGFVEAECRGERCFGEVCSGAGVSWDLVAALGGEPQQRDGIAVREGAGCGWDLGGGKEWTARRRRGVEDVNEEVAGIDA